MTSNLTVSAFFTKSGGQPATGLTLADISLFLTAQNKSTGVDTVVWDGSQNPTEEIDNVGAYTLIYNAADLQTYDYFVLAQYTGGTTLDTDYVSGAVGTVTAKAIDGNIEFTYTVELSNGDPIEGVTVQIHTDSAGTNLVWVGTTDAYGVARDGYGNLPALNAGAYYFFSYKSGYTFSNPDTETVS